jgi:Uma2 family endonuclease
MIAPAHRIHYTWDEYVAFERTSNVKHEYLAGQIYAMAGGTPEHAALAAALIGLLFPQIRGGRCRSYDADLRVRVLATGLATYPDVTIICGPREHDPADAVSVTNPTLLVEVTSRSTDEYDRGDKFEHYKQIASLQEYVLVSHRERSIEVWTRGEDGSWTSEVAREARAVLTSIGATIDVNELYDAATQPA